MNSDNFSPYVDSSYDLGTSSLYFRNAYIDAITTTGAVGIGGLLTHARTQGTVTESALSGTATASMQLTTNYTYTGTNTSGTYARQDYLNLAGTGGSFGNVAGYQMKTDVTSTGTGTAIKNIMSRVHTASAGDINTVANFATHNEFSGTGNVGTWAGLAIADIGTGFENTRTITNTYGIKIGDITHGTQTNAPYAIHTGSERVHFGGNVNMASGNATGKFAVKSTAVHANFDFYNDGTTYLNGTTTVDADLRVSGTSEDTFIIGPQAAGSGTILMSLNAAENAYEPLRLDVETFKVTASGGTSPCIIETSGLNTTFGGNILASADSSHDIGTSSVRFANVYADTLYGDGSNLTNLPAQSAPSNMVTTDTTQTISGCLLYTSPSPRYS